MYTPLNIWIARSENLDGWVQMDHPLRNELEWIQSEFCGDYFWNNEQFGKFWMFCYTERRVPLFEEWRGVGWGLNVTQNIQDHNSVSFFEFWGFIYRWHPNAQTLYVSTFFTSPPASPPTHFNLKGACIAFPLWASSYLWLEHSSTTAGCVGWWWVESGNHFRIKEHRSGRACPLIKHACFCRWWRLGWG